LKGQVKFPVTTTQGDEDKYIGREICGEHKPQRMFVVGRRYNTRIVIVVLSSIGAKEIEESTPLLQERFGRRGGMIENVSAAYSGQKCE